MVGLLIGLKSYLERRNRKELFYTMHGHVLSHSVESFYCLSFSNLVIDTNSKPYQRKANYEEVEQHLQKLATTMFPTECNTWRAIDITDLTIKSKVYSIT